MLGLLHDKPDCLANKWGSQWRTKVNLAFRITSSLNYWRISDAMAHSKLIVIMRNMRIRVIKIIILPFISGWIISCFHLEKKTIPCYCVTIGDAYILLQQARSEYILIINRRLAT